ncbi:unnamed protein product [Rotaria sordida]|uniref:Uncharacterized protein n=1 Tax=Rotaria sordida TaxID=392033 RepID=A0A819BQS8_9BILA|nr:unnamed protein product [Rotaria sordida]
MGATHRERVIDKILIETQYVCICHSSHNDFNRVLARQPRTSINMPRFDIQNNLIQEPVTHTLSIPVPVPQNKSLNKNATAILRNKSPVENKYSEPVQTVQEMYASPPIEQTTSSSAINNSTAKKFKQERPQQQIIQGNTTHDGRFDLFVHNQTMNNNSAVISRSIMTRNDLRCLKNYYSSLFRPEWSIVEHNGKQFVVEFTQRTERRFVQFMDDKTHQMRLFEVIDCIPSTIIRPYKRKSQSLLPNDTSRLDRRSNQRRGLQPISNYRSPSSFVNKRGLKSLSFEQPTSTYSDDDVSTYTTDSLDSNEESETEDSQEIDRILKSKEMDSGYIQTYPFFFNNYNTIAVLNEAIGGYNLPMPFSSYVRSVYPNHRHHYQKLCTINNSAQPITKI